MESVVGKIKELVSSIFEVGKIQFSWKILNEVGENKCEPSMRTTGQLQLELSGCMLSNGLYVVGKGSWKELSNSSIFH